MPKSLDCMPPEIHLNILDAVTETAVELDIDEFRGIQHTLRALCLTSKSLKQATVPYLYREFDNIYKDETIRPFLNTVCKSPELAMQVHEMQFAISSGQQGAPFEDEELELLASKLSEKLANRTIFYQIANALASGCYAAQLLVLLSVTTELRNLKIYALSKKEDTHTGAPCPHCRHFFTWLYVLFQDPKVRGQFGKLEHLQIGSSSATTAALYPYGAVEPMLRLPALISFVGGCLYAEPGATSLSGLEPSSTLKKIQLDHAMLDITSLDDMLASTKVLSELLISFGSRSNKKRHPGIEPSALLSALDQHKQRLIRLKLASIPDEGHVFGDRTAIESLADFSSLQELEVDVRFLVDSAAWNHADLSHALPESLEVLWIHTYDDSTDAESFAIIFAALSRLTNKNLKEVVITFPPELEGRELIDEFAEALNKTDVGHFRLGEVDDIERLIFDCWAKPEKMIETLSGFATLLAENASSKLQYILDFNVALARNEEGKVFVPGLEEWLAEN